MLSSVASVFAAIAGLSACVDAHMIMASPVPYNKDSLNSSPLAADGSDFPCKVAPGGQYAVSQMNQMPIGSTQQLSFTGSAVHGGGSCQISITYDKNPTKDSKFEVIHSIVGGCPAKGVDGNLPEDPNGTGAGKYSFTIPQGVKEGEATLAWTWFNKVGNREMYMNCAPVTITGGGAKKPRNVTPNRKRQQSSNFPAMFIANIGNGCTTLESSDLEFPDPGSSVEKAGTGATAPPTGSCAAGGGSTGGGPNGGSPGQSPTPPTTTTAASGVSPTATPPAIGGVFIPKQGGNAGEEPASTAPEEPAAAPEEPVATPPSNGGSTGSGSTTSGGQTGPCTSEGAFNCLTGGTSFQQCGSGSWSVVMQMASGMTCTPGQASTLSMAPGKRDLRFARRNAVAQ
ncbi:MAG: hypothetical protein M1833_001112 [Piccolia ochrophora]|nr:MAG: hypothetical protein M1833_001112 [Piccolia ochrophora]